MRIRKQPGAAALPVVANVAKASGKTSGKTSGRKAPLPVGAAQAKTHLLALINEVRQSGTPVIITRRGKPQVQIAPLDFELSQPDIIGCMKGTFQVTGDIIGPEPDAWEAMQ